MPKLSEALLQFIWQHRLLKPGPLVTVAGKELTVLKPGLLNHDAGPDFSGAQISLNGLVLAGNIELHIKTSDWLRHGHQRDKNYNTLILHVVYEHDAELAQNTEYNVEVLELKNRVDAKTLEAYSQLADAPDRLPCAGQLKQADELRFTAWLERMAIERLEEKVKRLERLLELYKGDYVQTFYTVLLRNFGFHVNALPFELLAKHLPVQLLLKHADNLLQLEALLLGISGLLDNPFKDKYIQNLQNEFEYLKTKYALTPMQKELFKFSKLRPANFPTVRLVQLATLVHRQPKLFTAPQEWDAYPALMETLHIQPQGYWKNHYQPDGRALNKELALGEASAENIVINTFAPFFFFYSKKTGKPFFADLALQLLQQAAFETNVKTKLFGAKRSSLKSAADSQAIINLYDHYCSKKQCLKCGIAASLLRPVVM